MSEFGIDDCNRWLQLALENNCSIQDAIYYDLFFQCRRDPDKFMRAFKYFCSKMNMKLPESYPS